LSFHKITQSAYTTTSARRRPAGTPAAIVVRLNYPLSYANFNGMQIRSTEPAWMAQSGGPAAASIAGRRDAARPGTHGVTNGTRAVRSIMMPRLRHYNSIPPTAFGGKSQLSRY